MPSLEKIIIRDFRNINLQELCFCHKINCISGGNGEGKTNLLDAVWYLSMTKSAFSASDKFNFRHGTPSFGLSGSYLFEDGRKTRVAISVDKNNGKEMKRDDKPYKRISEHIGLIPIVMVSPSDSDLVVESGEERRKFANAVLSQTEVKYLRDIQSANNLLAQRNRILKDAPSETAFLDALDERLEAVSRPVFEARAAFCAKLAPVVSRYYGAISGEAETIGIEYRSDLSKGSLVTQLAENRSRDLALRYTGSGLQRDDFIFTMDGYPIRKCGSQGQQKSFLVALKFAQYEIMQEKCDTAPILLLDDLFDKLDSKRVANLLRTVSGSDFGQIFISDTNRGRVKEAIEGISGECRFFKAEGGTFANE